jgi:DNA-binding PadR family transcriptional regulator
MKLNSLHYVLLAGIDQEPRSGYDLTQWLAKLGQHYWAAEHSSIYPALQSLEAAGLLLSSEESGLRGRPRKFYRLSSDGREQLKCWVNEPSGLPETRDEQLVKVLCFDLLSRDEILGHLERIRAQHAAKLVYYEGVMRSRAAVPAATGANNTPERFGPALTLRRGILAAQSYVDWCDEALAFVRAKDWKG